MLILQFIKNTIITSLCILLLIFFASPPLVYSQDTDSDNILDQFDNCPDVPNGPLGGTCTGGYMGDPCMTHGECGTGGFCSTNQEDSNPARGNECGDACECEGNFDGDDDQDGSDAFTFKQDFGRSVLGNPCTTDNTCNGDFDCDSDCDGSDAFAFKRDFGRSSMLNPCPDCVTVPWCFYAPPDPTDLAPPLNPTVPTTMHDATEFLYTGDSPIQIGVTPEDINPGRVAVIRGRVLDKDNNPLKQAIITIHNHPEYGQTLSRDDGMFDLAVNGGGYLTVNYSKNGYLSAQRQADVPWQDFVWMSDVVLIKADPQVVLVDLTQTAEDFVVAQGSEVSDDRGTRQSTLLFPQGTEAEMVMPDGSTQAISNLTVRSTEYSVGDNGPEAMPAELPPGVGYTYCVELSLDEAVAAGADSVTFSEPLINYVENFLGFPVGGEVPAYYYDRNRGVWVSTPNGLIIEIVDLVGGLAEIDADGDGIADDDPILTSIGITSAEREQVAALYSIGQTLWRVPVSHFSPVDYNWPYDYSDDYPPPLDLDLDQEEDDPCTTEGSIIACQNQTLGESVGIVGTPFSLNYFSDRTAGRTSRYTLKIPLSGDVLPGLEPKLSIELEIKVAGKLIRHSFPPNPNQEYTFIWDGIDSYGRTWQGEVPITVRIGYKVMFRLCDGTGDCSFYIPSLNYMLWGEEWKGVIGGWDAKEVGLGGWTFDKHHVYDPNSRILYLGNGKKRSAETIGSVVKPAAKGSSLPYPMYNYPNFQGIAVGPDGSVYVASNVACRVFKFDPNGNVTVVAGNSPCDISNCTPGGFSGDGGPATSALLDGPFNVALGPDESIYISDTFNQRVRRVGPDGNITTVAGNGTIGFGGDGGPATEAQLNYPADIAVGPDGSLYITGNQSPIRRVGTDGIITTVFTPPVNSSQTPLVDITVACDGTLYVLTSGQASGTLAGKCSVYRIPPEGSPTLYAGNGTCEYSGDGRSADETGFDRPQGICVDQAGNLYIAVMNTNRIRRISSDKIVSTYGGCGDYDPPFCDQNYSEFGDPPTRTWMYPQFLAIGPDDSLYYGRPNGSLVNKVDQSLPGITIGEIIVPSEDGKEIYVFDDSGRHLSTASALTGATLYYFGYNDDNLLFVILDSNGNITLIERDDEGNPTAIVGPFGQNTNLTLDVNGYLASITNPAGETNAFSYTNDGLLTEMTDPNNNTSSYTYDSMGMLIRADDPAGGFKTLEKTKIENGHEVEVFTAEGRTSLYRVETLETGEKRITNTFGCCGQSEVLFGTDGNVTVTLPNGTVKTPSQGPDPRFGMQTPIVESLTTETPGGLISTITQERTVSLNDPDDPLSLENQTDTFTVNNRTYTRQFDALTNEITSTSPEGRQTITTLNSQGRPVQKLSAGIEPVSYSYDPRGRLETILQGSGDNERQVTFTYGTDGFIDSITDPMGRIFSFETDLAGRLTGKTMPDMSEITYGYDDNGNLTSITPPGRPLHLFTYTPVNLEEDYTPPDIGIGNVQTSIIYNLDRQVTQISRPGGATIGLNYDSSGNLELITTPRGNISHTYDPLTGSVSTISSPDGGVVTFSNDGGLLTDSTWTGEVAGNVTQDYNNNFWIVSRSVNGANTIGFTYDSDGLLTQAGALTISRDPDNGLLTGTSLGNVSDTLSYNDFGELEVYTAIFNGSTFSFDYTRDKLGRITDLVETDGGVPTTYSYFYDNAGRLEGVDEDGLPQSTYGYDDNGNRTNHNGVTATYDNHDRLIQMGTTTFSYSANGELESKTEGSDTTTYLYDVLGNLISVTLPTTPTPTQIDYVIGGMNRRIGKKIDGTLVQGFLYKDQLNPVAELDGSNTVVARFVYASKGLVPDYMVTGANTYRIISDHLGSPRMVVNTATGTIAQEINYDEFGNVLSDTNPGFQPFGFAGGLYDQDTKLTRFGARDYDAQTGRWTTKDPIRFYGGDTNLYGYVLNDPVNRVDPGGKECGSAVSQAYLQSLQDLLALRRERAMYENFIRNLETHIGDPRRPNPIGAGESLLEDFLNQFTWDGIINAFANAASGGAHDLYAPNDALNEQIMQRDEDFQAEIPERIGEHQARIADIDVQILAVEQRISLALQECPCLWTTDFP